MADGTGASSTRPADEVVRAEWVVVGDPADSRVLDDGAVAIVDGRIAAAGPAGEVLEAHPGLPTTRLERHVLVPGLVNTHTHLAMNMLRGSAGDRDLAGFLAVVMPLEARSLTPDRVERATRAAAVELVRSGVTTSIDMYFDVESGLRGASSVGLRLLTGPTLIEGGPTTATWDEVVAAAGEWLDRRPASGTWRPVIGPHGTYTVTPDQLAEVAAVIDGRDCILQIHLSETEAENQTVLERFGSRPLGVLDTAGLLTRDTVLAHGVHLSADEIRRVAEVGAAVAHCPASNLKLASGVAPVRDLLAAGATVSLGTDGQASNDDLDLLAEMRLAALLHKGTSSGAAGPDATALPAPVALRMATLSGAEALGLEALTGSIEVGKVADLTAVDLSSPWIEPVRDPIGSLVYSASRADVAAVWVEGRAVVSEGRCVNVDERDVVRSLRSLGEEIHSS